jgi:hypothetical protein
VNVIPVDHVFVDGHDYHEEKSQGKKFTKIPQDMAVLMVSGNNFHWSSGY